MERVLRVIFSVYLFTRVILFSDETPSIYELTLQSNVTIGIGLYVVFQALTIINTPEITIAIFNFIFAERKQSREARGRDVKFWIKILKKYSLEELAAIYFPHTVGTLLLAYMLMIAHFCKEFYLYQVLPQKWANPLILGILVLYDGAFFLWIMASFVLMMENIFLFLTKIDYILISEINTMRKQAQGQDSRDEGCIRCRNIVLYVRLFNMGHSSVIYLIKQMFLICGVSFGYMVVRSFSYHIGSSLAYLALFICAIFTPAAFFGNAFHIPARIQSLKQELMLCSAVHANPNYDKGIF
ncbi:unnamed protein product, partial [Allacma fusca]